MKNMQVVGIIVAGALFCLQHFGGWAIPDWVIGLPVALVFLTFVLDSTFYFRQFIKGHRQLSIQAKNEILSKIKADVEMEKEHRRLERQEEQTERQRKKRKS